MKKQVLAIGGLVVGVLTLRSLRNRRSKADEEPVEEEVDEGPETAIEHAAAAAEHAQVAASKVLEERRENA